MGENGSKTWKVVTIVFAVLLVGAVVAIVVLATSGGNESDTKALEEKVQTLEDQVTDLNEQLAEAQAKLEEQAQDGTAADTTGTKTPTDREQLEALGEQMTGDNFYVGEIVIDGDWARVSIAPKDPTAYQGELVYYHKINGEWTYMDSGTGLQYGDIPGAPASIFP
ncbi:MAG: hypothetical protein C4536_14125 [Actinobacteria bacterium]|nr:MAG: hypothetical protein C4536_14125 [Actinomycetota bacterium]